MWIGGWGCCSIEAFWTEEKRTDAIGGRAAALFSILVATMMRALAERNERLEDFLFGGGGFGRSSDHRPEIPLREGFWRDGGG